MSGLVERVLPARDRGLGSFAVRRLLPAAARRHVGPFVFLDHLGPVVLGPGDSGDVPPHPHIGLATITYLFAGEVTHRDSLGSVQVIRPGEVNWMIAGRGIVHSERPTAACRAAGGALHGLQTWVALPREHEEMAPRFEHHAAVPRVELPGVTLTVIAGTAYGARAPAGVLVPTLYVHAELAAGARVALPDEHPERAIYVVAGEIEVDGTRGGAGHMLVLGAGGGELVARTAASAVMLGGAPLDGDRHMVWNFVSTSRERIDEAARRWRDRAFAVVPGDEAERAEMPAAR